MRADRAFAAFRVQRCDDHCISFVGVHDELVRELATKAVLHDAVRNSLITAGVSAVLATCLGGLAARAGALHRFPMRRGIWGLIMVPLVWPEIIVAISLLVVVVQILHLPLSNLTVIAAHTLICVPFWQAFIVVTVPLIMPGVVFALFISFTISLD